jgi:hypothetical protein
MKPPIEPEGSGARTIVGTIVAVLGIMAGAMMGSALHMPALRGRHAQPAASSAPPLASPRVEPALFHACPPLAAGCDA